MTLAGAGAIPSRAPRGRLLIVEDDEGVSESLYELLSDEGYEAVVTRNGQEAVDWLAANAHRRLMLLVLWMPVLNGEEFRARQLADPTLADIPVVVISAAGDARSRGRAMKVTAVLPK